ncbi:unnamed protein product [Schistocephalus solidus]|uniref:Secreted protein n=1 Tax=Schistocephalus solidus TaxID=70667 RepID=A0A183SEF7_SCHSO|nr:unnamed protein product [Schistocephalus solidus]
MHYLCVWNGPPSLMPVAERGATRCPTFFPLSVHCFTVDAAAAAAAATAPPFRLSPPLVEGGDCGGAKVFNDDNCVFTC